MSRPKQLLKRPRPNARPLNLMRPDAELQVQLPLQEIEVPPTMQGAPEAQAYLLGECSVLISRELGKYHLSIAHPARYPTWDEIAQARYRLLPAQLWFAIYLPPREQYVNVHRYCFQLLECEQPG